MSATIQFSDKPCFECKKTEMTFRVSLKDGTFKGVLCGKHLHEQLADRWIEEQKKKAVENGKP